MPKLNARILAKDVVVAAPQDTVASAAARMAQGKVGSVAVVDADKKLVGIFTERDLVYRVVAKGLDPAKTALSQVMTPDLATVKANDPLEKVFEALSQNAHRHLPILDGEELIGMASLHDFASLLPCLAGDEDAVQKFAEVALASPRQAFRLRKS